MYVLSQQETTLHCNVVSRWLSVYTEWSQPAYKRPNLVINMAQFHQQKHDMFSWEFLATTDSIRPRDDYKMVWRLPRFVLYCGTPRVKHTFSGEDLLRSVWWNPDIVCTELPPSIFAPSIHLIWNITAITCTSCRIPYTYGKYIFI